MFLLLLLFSGLQDKSVTEHSTALADAHIAAAAHFAAAAAAAAAAAKQQQQQQQEQIDSMCLTPEPLAIRGCLLLACAKIRLCPWVSGGVAALCLLCIVVVMRLLPFLASKALQQLGQTYTNCRGVLINITNIGNNIVRTLATVDLAS
ncbi:hypothetical protein COO60DRAFT_1647707 [Scenedesmus sp. NREL 46B-D3]|nr:hypothetical protein COO60DRAFT_1647707 [Scenedesmus sp. NREL 46B-D3]